MQYIRQATVTINGLATMKKTITFLCFILLLHTGFGQTIPADSLSRLLSHIRENDQQYRQEMDFIASKYAGDTAQLKQQLNKQQKIIAANDSINRIQVTAIIDRYGWLGPDIIGEPGNTTLFLVIQHADIKTQEKYLPVMRDAVKNGKAKASSLALLEDRVALLEGRRQIYGSQVSWNVLTNEYYVLPLDDPDNVDKRRAAVGLPPLAVYLGAWQLKWDVEQYKKDLPGIEAKLQHSKK